MRYYPTDLLLAVEEAERALTDPESELTRLLGRNELGALQGLFTSATLTDGLDRLFGGLTQYPWQPDIDGGDVRLLTPVGTVAFDDVRAGNTLRGLLLAWAAGNAVVVRTGRPEFWTVLGELLRGAGHPLPALGVQAAGSELPDGVRLVAVPDVVVAAGERVPEVFTGEGQASPDADAIVLRLADQDPRDLVATLTDEDCRSPWATRLLRREHLIGTTLAAARSADAEQEDARIGARLRYLTGQARRAPYYRDLPAVRTLDDLTLLPVLDKAGLEANSLPGSRGMSSDRPATGEVLRSGASTGAPRYIVYSRADWENMISEALPLFRTLGLDNGDRLINTLYGGGLYGGLSTTLCELSRLPVECYSTAQAITVETLLMLCDSFGANVLLGLPVLIMPLLREAKQRRPELRLEKVIYGGTPMTENDKQWLRTELGAKVVTSILAANDGAQLGYQCTEMGGTLHHICPDYNLIEVVDEQQRPVPAGESGELLITSLQKFEGPLIRYRIGDVGRIFPHDCACGVSGPVLEYLGRADGQIKVKGATVTHAEMLTALESYQVSLLQVEILSQDSKEVVIARVESPLTLDPTEIRDFLVREFKTLGQDHLFDSALDVFELIVECLPEGGLTRNDTSGKIKPVIDRRVTAA